MTSDFEFIGPYRVVRILGQGGMGTVYEGVHTKSNEPVAIKVISAAMAQHQRFRRRFDAEIQTLLKLKHPNIVELLGFGEERGLLFYSMELVDGENLQQMLRREKKLPWKQVLDYAIDVCAALKHAHDAGIIHRDLKPANLMISQFGKIKLTDFGIAKLFGGDGATVEGAVIGTADFMPPEQAEGKPVTNKSDIYALGAVCYAALCGRAPFQGKNIPEVLFNVRYGKMTSLKTLAPDVPIEFIDLIHELLERDPSKRPANCLLVGNRMQAMRIGLASRTQVLEPSLDARKLTELTSIDIDPSSLIGEQAAANRTKLMTGTPSNLPQSESIEVSKTKNTNQSVAGPDDRTRVQISESEFELNDRPSGLDFIGKTNFTEVHEEHRKRSVQVPQTDTSHSIWIQRISVAVLALLLIACIVSIVVLLRPQSANQLYSVIAKAIESNEEDAWVSVEPEVLQFIELYPDDERIEDVQSALEEITAIRSARQLQRRAKREGFDSLSAIEQAYLECVKAEELDTLLAKQKLQAFLIVFGNDNLAKSKHKGLVKQATRTLERLSQVSNNKSNQAYQSLKEQMDWADANLSPDLRKKWRQAIVELFQDKVWARDLMERARLQD